MIMEKKQTYISPELEVYRITVEQGFAVTGFGGNQSNDFEDGDNASDDDDWNVY